MSDKTQLRIRLVVDYLDKLSLSETEKKALQTQIMFAAHYVEGYDHGTLGHIGLTTLYTLSYILGYRFEHEGLPLRTVEEAEEFVLDCMPFDAEMASRVIDEIRLSVEYTQNYNHLGNDGVLYSAITTIFGGLLGWWT